MSRIRVVIAEDDPVVRKSLAGLVAADQMMEVVGLAADAHEAGELAREHRPDVAVLDVKMPHGGGPRAAEEIRRISPDTRIVALSAHEDRTSVLEMLRAGAVGYLVKGTPAREILEGIRRCFLGQSTLSAGVTGEIVGELATQLAREAKEADQLSAVRRRIRRVLSGEGLEMVFQPIADLRNGKIAGLEALARFSGEPQQDPDRWFAEASPAGLLVELETAAVMLAVARMEDLAPETYLSVNLSPQTILTPAFKELFPIASRHRLVVEITEHAPVEDYESLRTALSDYRDGGGRLAVDDAGAGFASLRHILRLAPDIIKLDLSITRGIDSDQASQALADALVSFAARIGATIVAEGIETTEELAALLALGVTHGQGFYLSRPGEVPLDFDVVPSLSLRSAPTPEAASAGG